MVDESEDADAKIADFGLSKMIGPNEECTEPFGTLSYVTPEVLLHLLYDKSVDVWSLGVIAYLLLSGTLPFYNDNDKEIVRQTIHNELDFNHSGWGKISKEAIDLVLSNNSFIFRTPYKGQDEENNVEGSIGASVDREILFRNYRDENEGKKPTAVQSILASTAKLTKDTR